MLSSTLQTIAPAAIIASGFASLIIEAEKKNARSGFDRGVFHYVSNREINMIGAHRETVCKMENAHPHVPLVCGQSLIHNNQDMTIAYVNEELNQVMLLSRDQFDML